MFTEKDIELVYTELEKITQNLDSNKAHDMISIHTLKISGESIAKPLEIIYNKFLERVVFPSNGRGQMLFLSIKGDKQLLKSYQPIYLLPVCSKVLERLLYNSVFEFLMPNNLTTANQSGFKAGDAFINQLILITHEI